MTEVRPFDLVLLPVLWSAALWIGRGALRAGRRRRALAAAFALAAVAATAGVPAVRRRIDALLGFASATNLLVHLLTFAAITALVDFVHASTGPADRPARHWYALPAAAAALTTLFAVMPRPDGDHDLLTEAAHPLNTAYWTLQTAYLAWGLAITATMTLRYGRHAAPGPLRTSLRLIAAGSLAGLGYALHRIAYTLARGGDRPLQPGPAAVATTQLLVLAALLLLAVGAGWPSAVERARLAAVRRRIRRLRPLWDALRTAAPEVVLPLPARLRADPDLVLYRLVIEIGDSMLALRPLLDAGSAAGLRARLAAGLSGAALETAVEAALLRGAVERARRPDPAAPRPAPASPGGWAPADDLAAEVARLTALASAYSGRAVARALAQVPG